MDTASVLIGIFFLLLFIFPLAWITLKQFNFQKKQEQKIKKFGRQNDLNFTNLEINYWSFLGLDELNKKLIFGEIDSSENIQQLSIEEIQNSQVISNSDKVSEIKEIKIKLSGLFGVKEILFYKDEAHISADAAVYMHTAKKWLGYIQKA
ncbi:hypothetical protein [Mesonia sp.]|uniref:hypothetical protein n=1 Tax=Mesonia sp. TaxID=1960830 RepID=UPI001755B4DE|nr:hypothetical protein [Mesonia sp.]HIB36198.1 hypothetical protein [Mesonia sp.]HIO26160.1 hypothetical protein [Flavobacteriaceae bacterium]